MKDDDKPLKLIKMFDKQINKELSEIMKRYRDEEITATNRYLSVFKNIDKVVVTNIKFHPGLSVYIDVYSDDRYFNEDDVQSFTLYLKEKLEYMGYPWIVPKLINQKSLNESERDLDVVYSRLEKIWNKKSHPKFDKNLTHFVGLDTYEIIRMFIDYLGTDEFIERIDKIVSNHSTWTPIIGCGTYIFDFVIRTYEINYEEFIIEFYCNVNGDGSVVVDGELMTIEDALLDDEFGWEIEMEIKDCIHNKIYEEVNTETGFWTHINFT